MRFFVVLLVLLAAVAPASAFAQTVDPDWMQTASEQSGIPLDRLQEAERIADYDIAWQTGGGPDQTRGLVALAALVSKVHHIDVVEAMNQIDAALQGNVPAARFLGVHLDPSYVAYTQINGATAEVFDGLDMGTRLQLRYTCLLQQTNALLNAAS